MATGMTIVPAQAGPLDLLNPPTIVDPVFDGVGSTDMVWSTSVVLSSRVYTVLEVTDAVGLVLATGDGISTMAMVTSVPPTLDLHGYVHRLSAIRLNNMGACTFIQGGGRAAPV